MNWKKLSGLSSGALLLLLSAVSSANELPADAQAAVAAHEKALADIEREFESKAQAAHAELKAQLEKLQTAYTKDGKLDEAVAIRDFLRAGINAPKITPLADPGSLTAYRSEAGRVLYFDVTGSSAGTLYGTDVYTHDSYLAPAAVHAGVLKLHERGVVKVTILPPQSSFKSTGRNGVSSSSWSSTEYECYKVESAKASEKKTESKGSASTATVPAISESSKPTWLYDPGNLQNYRNKIGESFVFLVTGSKEGRVYGSDVYSDDSLLKAAAVHAGVLKDQQTGVVRVKIMGPGGKFEGTSRHGVTSYGWGNWEGSYKVEEVKAVKLEDVKETVRKIDGVKEVLNQADAIKDALKK